MKKPKDILAGSVVSGAQALHCATADARGSAYAKTNSAEGIRTFAAHVPQADLDNLRQRLLATRWHNEATATNATLGSQHAKLQALIKYWGTKYDWRKFEEKLNTYPQFITTIDGVDIHFIHVRSKHTSAIPVVVTHGWPGSVVEQIKIIEPLTNPTAHGGTVDDAFDVIIPSHPGYGFSARSAELGWGLDRIARAWDVLVKRLGYHTYVAHGSDWAAGVVERMAVQKPRGLLAIHTNSPAVFPPDAAAAIASGGPVPEGLSKKERAAFDDVRNFIRRGGWSYYQMTTQFPAANCELTASPAGLARWILVHGGFGKWIFGQGTKHSPSIEDVLDNFSLYWFTKSAFSDARVYWKSRKENLLSAGAQKTGEIQIPVAITAFKDDDLFRAPETWAQRAFPTLVYFHEAERGVHFAAWVDSELFASELRASFKFLRNQPATPKSNSSQYNIDGQKQSISLNNL